MSNTQINLPYTSILKLNLSPNFRVANSMFKNEYGVSLVKQVLKLNGIKISEADVDIVVNDQEEAGHNTLDAITALHDEESEGVIEYLTQLEIMSEYVYNNMSKEEAHEELVRLYHIDDAFIEKSYQVIPEYHKLGFVSKEESILNSIIRIGFDTLKRSIDY